MVTSRNSIALSPQDYLQEKGFPVYPNSNAWHESRWLSTQPQPNLFNRSKKLGMWAFSVDKPKPAG
jgi:hypothetical protein